MEGNACYKFSTIKTFVRETGAKPISTIVDVGVNVGDTILLERAFFPSAYIRGFEPVDEYFNTASERTARLRGVEIYQRAVTSEHLYEDDLGTRPRPEPTPLAIAKSLPAAGPGWIGGSIVKSDQSIGSVVREGKYELANGHVEALTLADILAEIGAPEIDILKMDCEGSECPALGCADEETLRRIRFIVGEYHELARFWPVMRDRLFQTHNVNLVGDKHLGAFFAERIERRPRFPTNETILQPSREGMLKNRPWLLDRPIEWNLFDERYVAPAERAWHGLPERA